MPRHNHVMEDLIHDSCKIRKRGCSSSSSTSSKLHNYRFKRAIVVGNKTRKGLGSRSSTPVPTWKTTSLLRNGGVVESPKYESSKSRPVSARKLAATLWEMNEMPKVMEEKMKIMKTKEKLRSVVSGSLPPHLSDPSHSPVSEVGFSSSPPFLLYICVCVCVMFCCVMCNCELLSCYGCFSIVVFGFGG